LEGRRGGAAGVGGKGMMREEAADKLINQLLN